MYRQGQELLAWLRLYGWWPTAEQAATRSEAEWRAAARDQVKHLQGTSLVALVWLATALYLVREEGETISPMEAEPDIAEIRYGEPPAPYEEPTRRQLCAEWLLALLKERGELPAREIIELAAEAGFRQATVFRARATLRGQIVNTQGRRNPHNKWTLTDQRALGA